ncbi:MAG TPA: hypothetical protein VFY17_03850 [Pilimelia sp.]|nr:hypothetical protein [Pilimelia sp.]
MSYGAVPPGGPVPPGGSVPPGGHVPPGAGFPPGGSGFPPGGASGAGFPPARPQRPGAVTAAAALIYAYVALTLVGAALFALVFPDLRAAIDALPQADDPAREATEIGMIVGVSVGVVVLLLFGAVLAVLAAFVNRGRNGARIGVWVLGGLTVCCGTLGALSDGLTMATGLSDGNTQAFLDALPGWYTPTTTALRILGVLCMLAAVVLLALPASHAYFRPQPAGLAPAYPPPYPAGGAPYGAGAPPYPAGPPPAGAPYSGGPTAAPGSPTPPASQSPYPGATPPPYPGAPQPSYPPAAPAAAPPADSAPHAATGAESPAAPCPPFAEPSPPYGDRSATGDLPPADQPARGAEPEDPRDPAPGAGGR